MKEVAEREPPRIEAELDAPVEAMSYSLSDYYQNSAVAVDFPLSLDATLRDIFENLAETEHAIEAARVPAASYSASWNRNC